MSTRSRIEMESHKDPRTLEREIDAKRAEISGTVAALENKLSPGEIFERVLGFARGNGREFADNLSASVKANPVPMLLTGVGLAWMMVNQQRGPEASRYYYREDSVGTGVYGTATYGDDSASGVRAKAGELRDRASGSMESAKAKLGSARDSMSDQAHRAGDAMHRAGSSVRRHAGEAREGLDSMLREQPLAVAAIGIALGALFGGMLPPTRREDELMGSAADRARRMAREKAEEARDMATEKATEAASKGLDRANERLAQQGSNGQAGSTGSSTGTGSAASY